MEIYIICKCIVEGQVAGSAQTFALRLENNLIIIYIIEGLGHLCLPDPLITLPLIWMLFIQNVFSIIKLTFSSSSRSSNIYLKKGEQVAFSRVF